MLSLRHILALHPTILLIDAASAQIQVGLLRAGEAPLWEAIEQEAGIAVFLATESLLARADCTLDAVDAFVFCEGPGSVLGIRTSAVTLRTWQVLRARPIYSFNSLILTATFQRGQHVGITFSIIADARRESWHRVEVNAAGMISPLQRVPLGELSGTLYLPRHFRHWAVLPPSATIVPYALTEMLPALSGEALFSPAPEPDAFLHEAPAYQTWTPHVHRAPS